MLRHSEPESSTAARPGWQMRRVCGVSGNKLPRSIFVRGICWRTDAETPDEQVRESIEQAWDYHSALADESDRGAAILAVAHFEISYR